MVVCLYIHYLHFLYKIHRPFLPLPRLPWFVSRQSGWSGQGGAEFLHILRGLSEVKVSAQVYQAVSDCNHFRRKYRVHHGVRQECGRIVMNLFFEFHSIRLKVCILPCQREQDRYAGLDLIKTYLSYTVQ